ncbi:MAG: glycosyltransferase [Dehalococcoidia bacterium]|nr:glycosyltransferase [Dehalococcoidia bacterium]
MTAVQDDQPTHQGRQGSPRARLFAAVATYNRPDVAERAVRALLDQTRPPDGIVVVENSAEPQFEGRFPPHQVEVIRPGRNTGAAGGFGIGAQEALARGATHVVFVDDDCILHPTTLARIEHHVTRDLRGAVVGPVVVAPDGEALVWDVYRADGRAYAGRSVLPCHPLPTRDMAFHGLTVSAKALRTAGGPRPDLFFGGPDVEFSLRLAAHGYSLFYLPDAVATHHAVPYHTFWWFGPRKVVAGTPGHRYYVLRNRLLMWRMYRRDPAITGVGRLLAREVVGALVLGDRARRLRLLASALRDGLVGDPFRTLDNAVPLNRG